MKKKLYLSVIVVKYNLNLKYIYYSIINRFIQIKFHPSKQSHGIQRKSSVHWINCRRAQGSETQSCDEACCLADVAVIFVLTGSVRETQLQCWTRWQLLLLVLSQSLHPLAASLNRPADVCVWQCFISGSPSRILHAY